MISIIIPSYNSEKYITETINSVISQTYSNWELIIIDDGSIDSSANIIQEISYKDARIKYYYQENSGVSAARNHGIKKAKGEFISFIDADDCWKPTNLEVRLALFSKNVDWIYGSIELINEISQSLNKVIKGNDENILHSLLSWNGNVITTPSTLILKKKCIENLKFDTSLSTAADQDFVFYLAKKFKGKYLDIPLVQYRVLNNSMSRNINLMEKDHIAVYKKAEKNKLFKSVYFKQKCFSNLYWILAGSWWKDGDNKLKSLKFIIKAIITFPFPINNNV